MATSSLCQWSDDECKRDRRPGERFCPFHRKAMILKMRESGYLQGKPPPRLRRPASHQEDVKQTKFGVDE